MNIIIIDDNKMNRGVLENFVEKTQSLKLIGSYKSPTEALNDIRERGEAIDLVFLDIEMPEMSGIEFLESFKMSPYVVIVSGKKEYAVDAFEYEVSDYILKPATYPRFLKSIERVESQMIKGTENNLKSDSNEIFIKSNSTLVRLSYDDILYIEALENYVTVVTYEERYTIHFSMKAILDKLPAKIFKRVHRSFIMNVHKIDSIEDNNITVKLGESRKIIPVGKSYKDQLMKQINVITK